MEEASSSINKRLRSQLAILRPEPKNKERQLEAKPHLSYYSCPGQQDPAHLHHLQGQPLVSWEAHHMCVVRLGNLTLH